MSTMAGVQKLQTPAQLRRRKRADARRLEILRGAGRVFRERGFAAARMSDIAAAAELSSANLYHYFHGKDEILFYCQDGSLDRLLNNLAAAQRGDGRLRERLRTLAVAHVLCLLDEAYGFAAHMEVDALPVPLRNAIVAKRDMYERGVRALVESGIRRRQLRRIDPALATRALLGSLNWTARWFQSDGPATAEHVAEVIADFVTTGLAGDAPRRAARSDAAAPRTPGHTRGAQGAARAQRSRQRPSDS